MKGRVLPECGPEFLAEEFDLHFREPVEGAATLRRNSIESNPSSVGTRARRIELT
jgi:hypothetical protein